MATDVWKKDVQKMGHQSSCRPPRDVGEGVQHRRQTIQGSESKRLRQFILSRESPFPGGNSHLPCSQETDVQNRIPVYSVTVKNTPVTKLGGLVLK